MAAPDTSDHEGTAPGSTILHRKTEAGRAVHKARAMSLAKALRLTSAKVADSLYELPLAVIGLRSETVPGDAIADRFSKDHLLMLFEGPLQNRGAVGMDADAVAALIQQQTMGRVSKSAEGDTRPFTATDAAVCAPFLDAVLARAADMSEDADEQRLISGYAFGAWVDSPRALSIALEAHEYEIFQITFDIAGGVRQGNMILGLPRLTAEVELIGPEDAVDLPPDLCDASRTLNETVQNLKADLRIGLASLRLPLRQLGALRTGALLDIGTPDFARVMVQASDGKVVSRGALGQVEGQRAVQVAQTYTGLQKPRRRASDRAGLGHPDIAEGQASPESGPPSVPVALPAATGMLPTLTDSSSEADEADLPGALEMPDMSDLPDLPDLPDMSDLPELDDLPDLPAFGTP